MTAILLTGAVAAEPEAPVRVLTFNVLGCRGFPVERGAAVAFPDVQPILLRSLAERLRAWRVDVAILQEAPPEAAVRSLAEMAGMQAAYLPTHGEVGPEWPFGFPGAILSRHRLSEVCDLAAPEEIRADGRFQRFWGSALVSGPGWELRVMGTHLCADWGGVRREGIRLAEIDRLLRQPQDGILACDANTRPGEAPWRRLSEAGWRDVWCASHADGPGLTSDSRRPTQRIDQLWLSPGCAWRVQDACVLDDLRVVVDGRPVLLSDHRPVLCALLPPSAGHPVSPRKPMEPMP